VAISVLRSIVATTTVDAIYTSARDEVERRAIVASRALLDAYGAGVQLVSGEPPERARPEEVHAAFRERGERPRGQALIINRATTFARRA